MTKSTSVFTVLLSYMIVIISLILITLFFNQSPIIPILVGSSIYITLLAYGFIDEIRELKKTQEHMSDKLDRLRSENLSNKIEKFKN